jgi:hypothetical protein
MLSPSTAFHTNHLRTIFCREAGGCEARLLPRRYAAEEDDELDEPVLGVLAGEGAVEAVEAGPAAGAVFELLPALSDTAGAFVLSVLSVVGFSEGSLPELGFILSE